jgi:hypothetical protein
MRKTAWLNGSFRTRAKTIYGAGTR